jgi:predicted Zn-dependent protease
MMRMKLPALAIALALCASLPSPAQFGMGKKKDPEKEHEKEVKKAAKDAQNYEKLKEFSTNLYENDLEFRDAVDDYFETVVLKSHSEYAYQMNINRSSQTLAVHEDRFRIHSYLYDNLVVQDYVNRLGQKLVPADSDKLFAFRLTPSPIPSAYAMSTGTIYISTGLVAMLDNEAQLVYVLAHEMAHVYKDHWKLKAMLQLGQDKYNEKQEIKRAIWTGLATAAGAGLGAAIGRSGTDAAIGAVVGGAAGLAIASYLNPLSHLAWDKVQEDEADKIAFKTALDANYDVKEVPKLYLALQTATAHDSRVGLGFMGKPQTRSGAPGELQGFN